jgi:hypothetical protein
MHRLLLCLLAFTSIIANAEIVKWVDKDGQVHFSDRVDDVPDNAQPAEIGQTNSAVAPLPIEEAPAQIAPAVAPKPPMTASLWAEQHCTIRVRILYTERPFIPCAPTDEVPVYLCDAEVPRKYSRHFGMRYRYEDRESQCGPEVYEGEILYLKQ